MPTMIAKTFALDLAKQLIAIPSISPNDGGCQKIIADYLQSLNFTIEHLSSGDIQNLWARIGNSAPLVVFAGHTDVVPPGPLTAWMPHPFQPLEKSGYLYGRGAADMKTAIATMMAAVAKYLSNYPKFNGSIAFLITSCEEETTRDGTLAVMKLLQQRQEKIDYCIVGEAASEIEIGDQIKNGRRGSLNGELIIRGKQGHIAYPHLAENPVHRALLALQQLTEKKWDEGDAFFSPTSFQISNVTAGTGATNVIPGELKITFNFRYSPAVTAEQLMQEVETILKTHQLDYGLEWFPSAEPFITPEKKLVLAAKEAIKTVVGREPSLSTSGGTSDARFIAPFGVEVIELGFVNDTIHQVNECVKIADIAQLETIYYRLLENLLSTSSI